MQKTKKTLISSWIWLLAAVLMIPNLAFAQFTDLDDSHPQYDAIMSLYNQDIVRGYDDGTFQPDKLVNKAAFFKMLFNHVGYYPQEGLVEVPFVDVGDGFWFAPYVVKALDLGLIKFNPEVPIFLGASPVSRIEALRYLMPLEGIPVPYTEDTNTIFEDIEPDYRHMQFIQAAENSGVFIEEENPYFFPESLLTRGDAAELLVKAQFYSGGSSANFVPDLSVDLTDSFSTSDPTENDLITNPKFPIFLNVWTKINEQYLDQDHLNQNELVYGAISGMVDSLHDPYSLFEKPEGADELWDTLEGSYEGIGTIIDTFEDQFIIIGVINNSPADQAGLKTGDIITAIDGETFEAGDINSLIDAIKGPSGTEVTISVERDGTNKTFKVTREQITLDTVLLEASNTEVPTSIGYIAIYQFTDTTSSEFESILEETLATDPKGLIIDLRDNPGGYVDSALNILGHFVEKDEIIAKIKVSGENLNETSKGNGSLVNIPMVVLVNENTASAAEIVAAALQEHDLATIVGQQTYGKGTVQEVNIYSDGSLLKLSIAKWLTPSGKDIDHIGIPPDIKIEPSKDDVLGKTDSQLQKAIDELEKVI